MLTADFLSFTWSLDPRNDVMDPVLSAVGGKEILEGHGVPTCKAVCCVPGTDYDCVHLLLDIISVLYISYCLFYQLTLTTLLPKSLNRQTTA